MIKRGVAALAVFLGLAASPGIAAAGIYTDDLSRCLVKSASAGDQELLVQWMFAAMSLHPAVQPYSAITPAQRDALDKSMAQLMERLIFKDCRAATVAALKYEGTGTLQISFQVLGQVAGRNLMGNSLVAGELRSLTKYFDRTEFEAMAKEAGLSPPAK